MQQFIIHLNGGFNPFKRLGRGALGYRPDRRMIGRGKGDKIHQGGGGGGPPSDDDDDDNFIAVIPENTNFIKVIEPSDKGSINDEYDDLINQLDQLLPKKKNNQTVDEDDIQQGGGGGGPEPESEIVTTKTKDGGGESPLNNVDNVFAHINNDEIVKIITELEQTIEDIKNKTPKLRTPEEKDKLEFTEDQIKQLKIISKIIPDTFNKQLDYIKEHITTNNLNKTFNNKKETLNRGIVRYKKQLDDLIENKYINEKQKIVFDEIYNSILSKYNNIELLTKKNSTNLNLNVETPSNALNFIDIELNKVLNKKTTENEIYILKRNIQAYIKAINQIIEYKTTNNVQYEPLDNALKEYLDELNELDVHKKYVIADNSLIHTEIVKEKKETDLSFEPNLLQTKAEKKITEYWSVNKKPVKIEDDDIYDKKTKKIIKKINELDVNTLMDPEINENDEYIQMCIKTGSVDFPNKQESKKYMEQVMVNNKLYFYNDDGSLKKKMYTKHDKSGKRIYDKNGNIEKEELVMIDKEYDMAGKPAEFSICGYKNPFAKAFYDVKKPNIQVCDFIVEEITGSSGKQFAIDTVDFDNKLFIEMKYYRGINYIEQYNLNRKLKLIYINDIKNDIKKCILKLHNPVYKNNKESLKTELDNYIDILSTKDKFEHAFYKNNGYLGVGITMNKFANIEDLIDYINGPSTEEMINHVKDSQGRVYVPNFNDDRRITKITLETSKASANKNFNEKFNNRLKGEDNPYKYFVTCVFGKVVGVYNYTDDNMLDKNFILKSYKCSYEQLSGTKFNAVLIPIEKFLLKSLTSSSDILNRQLIQSDTLVPSSTLSHTPSTSTKNKKTTKPKNNEFEV